MQSDLHPTRSETCICSVGIGSRSSQLEQHASLFAAVDDSATLMVVGSVHRAPVGGCGLLRGERLLAYRLMDLAQDGVVWNAFSTFIAPLQGQMSRGRTGLPSPNENAWLSVFLGDRPKVVQVRLVTDHHNSDVPRSLP